MSISRAKGLNSIPDRINVNIRYAYCCQFCPVELLRVYRLLDFITTRFVFCFPHFCRRRLVSSVDIVTRLRTERPVVPISVGQVCLSSPEVQTPSGAHLTYSMGTCALTRRKVVGGMKLTM